jgi:hypothetical protein
MRQAATLCLALASLLLGASHANASDGDVLHQFGMIGVLAVKCGEPASSQNPYLTYDVLAGGKVTRRLEMSPDSDGTFTLSNLRPDGTNMLLFDDEGRGQGIAVSMARIGGKFRSWRSVDADGNVLIADGKFTGSGKATPAFELCRGPDSAQLH